MGNSDSKTALLEQQSTVATDIHSKASHLTDFTSFDNRDTSNGRGSERRKEVQSRDDEAPTKQPSTRITDDMINVNLAMADLMAYLQVVANNSNHLPLTRRDDPELDRMVTKLTSEEYARKSAAFLPADIRVIGGTFTRYGRVWDLPTREVRW